MADENQANQGNQFPNGLPGPQNPMVNEGAASGPRPSLSENIIQRELRVTQNENTLRNLAEHQIRQQDHLDQQKLIVREERAAIFWKKVSWCVAGAAAASSIVALIALCWVLGNRKDRKD